MRLILHRLSPRDTTLVKLLGATAGVDIRSSDAELPETASIGFKAALSCGFAARKGGWDGGRA
jgi:hypothetical protein